MGWYEIRRAVLWRRRRGEYGAKISPAYVVHGRDGSEVALRRGAVLGPVVGENIIDSIRNNVYIAVLGPTYIV